jgi:hypothetical protein
VGLQAKTWTSTERNWIRASGICILLISIITSVSILVDVATQAAYVNLSDSEARAIEHNVSLYVLELLYLIVHQSPRKSRDLTIRFLSRRSGSTMPVLMYARGRTRRSHLRRLEVRSNLT